jgi:hypothetical protein
LEKERKATEEAEIQAKRDKSKKEKDEVNMQY